MKITLEDCRSNANADQLDAIEHKLDRILRQLGRVLDQGEATMADLSAIASAVSAVATVQGSAVTLLERLASELAAAKTDPVAIQALADELNAQAASLAAAVVANTPVEDEPAPPVEPPVEPPA